MPFARSGNIAAIAIIGAILAVSHFLCDVIPHRHYYEASRLLQGFAVLAEEKWGALVELGLGGIILPIAAAFLMLPFWWLPLVYIFLSNLVDLLVFLRVGPVVRVNKLVHWHNEDIHWAFDWATTALFAALIVVLRKD